MQTSVTFSRHVVAVVLWVLWVLWVLLVLLADASAAPNSDSSVSFAPSVFPQQAAESQRCVVLLHGLARTWRSMRPVGRFLQKAGWRVVNQGYPSRSASVETLSTAVGEGFDRCNRQGFSNPSIDVVTHSMGGIILRQWVDDQQVRFGRVVMLGPPNNGSELVDRLGASVLFQWVNGPAGSQLGTGPNAIWRRLPAVTFELGVIAGVGEEGGFLGRHVAAPNDGKVSVASTRVAGMQDHLTLRVGHTFIMNSAQVHQQIRNFLLRGEFAPKPGETENSLQP